jgi:prepilin-type N-terminal cleavage/methylation domain-containing protein/prepilin-type processing-associated H-X9-DG protein
MENKGSKKAHGFTLVELLVVIAIIAVLLSVLMPALRFAKEIARRSICGKQMSQIGLALRTYADDNSDWLPPRLNVSSTERNRIGYMHWLRWFQVANATNTGNDLWNLGNIWNTGYLSGTGKMFYCPTPQDDVLYKYETYSSPKFPSNFALPGGAMGIRISYYFNPQTVWGKGSLSSTRFRKYEKLSEGKGSMILMTDLLVPSDPADPSSSKITHGKGWNMLYGDGSVRFSINAAAQTKLDSITTDPDFDKFEEVLNMMR